MARGSAAHTDPFPVAAMLTGFHRIADSAHDRVIDAVPDSGNDKHDHDEQRTQMENIGVELLKQCGYQRKNKTAGGIDHGIANVVFRFQSAGPTDIALFIILWHNHPS